MSNIIKHIRIEKLFGTKNIDWKLNPSVNVLVGQNGSGKSTILMLIQAVLCQKESTSRYLCIMLKITFNDGGFHTLNSVIHRLNEFDVKRLDKLIDSVKINEPNNESYADINQILELFKSIKSSNPEKKVSIFDSSEHVEHLNTEFISTINMSANSINNLTTSSGQNTTLLDIEITNELQRLLAFNDETLKENLLSALNSLFSETQKTIEFDGHTLVVKLTNGTQIDFDKLSSGERQVIFIFLKVVNASVDGALILMDEPEISLHLSWQEKLLNEIRRVNDKSQIIIVTHSPAILMNGWMDSFVDIKNIMTDATVDDDNTLSDSTV